MENSLTQLERKYNEMMKFENGEDFAKAFADYLIFVQTTPPFNRFLISAKISEVIQNFYNELKNLPIKGKDIKLYVLPYEFKAKSAYRKDIFLFNLMLSEKAKKEGMQTRISLIITDKPEVQGIAVKDHPSRQYLLRTNNTERFLIMKYLLRNKQGKVVKEIIKHLDKENDKENVVGNGIKKNIKLFNDLLKKELGLDRDVISTSKSGNKNKYSLNENDYIFILK